MLSTHVTTVDQYTFDSFLSLLTRDVLPVVALMAGVMAGIWIVGAAITISGYLIGAVVVVGVHASRRCLRRLPSAEPVTVDDAHAEVVHLDQYRRRRQCRRPDNVPTDDEPA